LGKHRFRSRRRIGGYRSGNGRRSSEDLMTDDDGGNTKDDATLTRILVIAVATLSAGIILGFLAWAGSLLVQTSAQISALNEDMHVESADVTVLKTQVGILDATIADLRVKIQALIDATGRPDLAK
jgi:hypothetical protein